MTGDGLRPPPVAARPCHETKASALRPGRPVGPDKGPPSPPPDLSAGGWKNTADSVRLKILRCSGCLIARAARLSRT